MANKCPKCNTNNPETLKFCGECGTKLVSAKGFDVTETLETFKEELTTGSTFARRYQIIEELGRGGMGNVYRALDKKLDEEVAIKLIKPEIASDKKTLERFSNELKIARRISHKNVGRMYEMMEHNGTHFITMEYIPGEDLKRLIRKVGRFSVGKTISVVKQICEGLIEAHSSGIVHRDLKSQNIMVDDEGTAKIMDFGIARFLGAKGLTGEGMIMGTLEYMSPEQVEGKGIDQRSDIYSLGIILYEMVTGRVPFEGDTPFIVGAKQRSETPKNPKKINPQIPDDLTQLILKCVEKDKEQRYQTVDQILREINAIQEDLATSERESDKPKRDTEKTVLTKWKNSIAVLPFTDLSPQKDQEYFCDGIAEEIISSLTKIKELRVVARTSAFSFKGRDVDVRDIGKKLNVESILEGSVRKAGNRLRINAQLIHVEDDYHIWSERYDRELDDVFAIQDEITQAIVKTLKVKLFGEEKELLVKRHTDNPEAHSLYLKGRYFWNKRTEDDLNIAIGYFKKAIEQDPEFAVAFVGLADSYNLLPWYSSIPLKDIHPKAKAAVEKALELDETLAEAHASLALFKWIYDWDWKTAEEEFKKAIALNPGYASAYHWYFEYLATMEKLDEAIAIIKKAQKYDPLSLIINSALGWGYYFIRQYDRAIEQAKKTLEMNPNFFWALYVLGISYLKNSNSGEAIKIFQKTSKISRDHPLFMSHLGVAFAWGRKTDKARDLVKELEKRVEKKNACSYFVALIYMALDNKEKAFEWLEKAYKDRDFWLLFIKVDPLFDSLRSDARFAALLKKLGLEK